MAIDTELLTEQMKNSRFRAGRFERLVSGEWVPWPILTLDRWAHEEAKRVAGLPMGRRARRVEADG